MTLTLLYSESRSNHLEVFLGKGVLKICSKCTGEHPCPSAISIKLQNSFIEITLRDGCSPVNLMHIFRTPFLKNTSGWLLLRKAQQVASAHSVINNWNVLKSSYIIAYQNCQSSIKLPIWKISTSDISILYHMSDK